MKVGQYVRCPIIDSGRGLGRVVAVSKVLVRVRWMESGLRGDYFKGQLEVICPTCAGLKGFGARQLERARVDCAFC